MKSMLIAMGLIGMMVVLSGSAFAQEGVVVNVDGSGGGRRRWARTFRPKSIRRRATHLIVVSKRARTFSF